MIDAGGVSSLIRIEIYFGEIRERAKLSIQRHIFQVRLGQVESIKSVLSGFFRKPRKFVHS